MAIVLVAVLALAVVAALAWPLLRPSAPQPKTDPRADERQDVQDELERSLRAIREIDFDHRAGNLSDADFAELEGAERARAVELLRERDALDS